MLPEAKELERLQIALLRSNEESMAENGLSHGADDMEASEDVSSIPVPSPIQRDMTEASNGSTGRKRKTTSDLPPGRGYKKVS